MKQKSSSIWDDIVPRVDPEKCKRCADCAPIAACLAGGFRRDDPDSVPIADEDFCYGCYSCVAACPHSAIVLPRQNS